MLREGSNGYTCWSSAPFLGGYPTCIDEGLTNFVNALVAGDEAPPASRTVAIGYMLQGAPAMSDDDPGSSLEQARAEGQEIFNGEPHTTPLLPVRAALAALPTSPDAGGPWVMWSDTPYVHVMVPAPSPN